MKRSADFIDNLVEEVKNLEDEYYQESIDIEQALGRSLGYPWRMDNPEKFPGATEDDGVDVGDRVPRTIAREAADKIWKWRAFSRLAGLYMSFQSELITVLNQTIKFHKEGRFTRQSYDRLKSRERELVELMNEIKGDLDLLVNELKETHESYVELQKGRARDKS